MRAKFSAQMDTGVTWVVSTRAPAATMRPTMVSSSGRPAATRLPKTMIKMAIVTGHDSISERSMAERLALLKSAHRALSPVSVTEMPGRARFESGPLRESAAFTMALGSAAAPAVTMAVRPSRDSETPGRGSDTVDTSGLARSVRAASATTCWASGLAAIGPLWSTTTTWSAVEPRPAKSRWTMSRALTDWLVESCQPAPASVCSTRTAKNPKAPTISSHTSSTVPKWLAVQRPNRASWPPWRAPSAGPSPAAWPCSRPCASSSIVDATGAVLLGCPDTPGGMIADTPRGITSRWHKALESEDD